MTTFTHWNPISRMARYEPFASFDDMLRDFGFDLRPWREANVSPSIRIDVTEDDKVYRVKAEMPGIEKKDIDVSIDGNRVSISAEVKREMKTEKGEKKICSERYFGKVSRSFVLPSELDSAKVEAQYDKGVLTLTLPKKANGLAGRMIAVH